MGTPVRVTEEETIPHQDMGAVSIIGTATLRWCAQRWGIAADPRRLRVNLVFDCDEPFAEEAWIGRHLRAGTAGLRVTEKIPRCRMIDVAQDGAAPDGRWLAPLASERDLCLAVYAEVVMPGLIAVGDFLGREG
jgi:uncharacterized protein YcbX